MAKLYQFPVRRTAAPAMQKPLRPTEPATGEVLGTIQGMTPGSKEEWRVAVALWKYKLQFQYQVPIGGGRNIRGGQVLDFLVMNPFPIPVQVFGEHWHSGQLGAEDQLKLARLQQIYKREPVIIWGSELQNQDAANAIIRTKVM